ncbi:cell wall hydrolase [Sphingobium sp. SCG-1]|nr:cell wall hydrolase [Sphingobium sp. SCG-1]
MTLIGFAVAVMLCLALSAWFVMAQRAVPDRLPNRINNQPIATTVSSLVVAPEALRPVSTQEAEVLNAAIPMSATPNPAARSMFVPLGDGTNFVRSLDCLTAAVYYEAASESLDGQRAVAQVVLNRTRHPAFPHSVCGVVFQGSERRTGCQFTFTCDGSLMRAPSKRGWAQARAVADAALAGYVYGPVGWATHYHTDYVAPYWAPTLAKAAVVGAHIFYRWPGGWGRPSAFTARYAGAEPLVDMAGGATGLKLEDMPAFAGMSDPEAQGTPAVAIPTMRSVLPFAARSAAEASAPVASSNAPVTVPSPTRWVIGARPAAEPGSVATTSPAAPATVGAASAH